MPKFWSEEIEKNCLQTDYYDIIIIIKQNKKMKKMPPTKRKKDYNKYNQHERKTVIKKLKQLWVYICFFWENADNATSHDLFLLIESVTFMWRQEVQSQRYLNRKLIYRYGNVTDFLEQVFNTSEISRTNKRKFCERFRMNRTDFWNLHKEIKDRTVSCFMLVVS